MVAGKRLARLNEQLKRELSELIRTEVRDPRVGTVTITGVEVARDLGSAKIFVRTVREDREATLAGLDAAAPFLRSRLGRSMRIRHVPELRFREDRSLEHARRIEDVLEEVARAEEEGHGEGGAGGRAHGGTSGEAPRPEGGGPSEDAGTEGGGPSAGGHAGPEDGEP